MKSTYEKMGGTYHQAGGYLLPNLATPEDPKISIWGQRRRKYLRDHQKPLYTAMLLGGTLNTHLEETDKSAAEMFDRLAEQMKHRNGITEDMKSANQLEWVQRMNVIRHEAAEIVKRELICV